MTKQTTQKTNKSTNKKEAFEPGKMTFAVAALSAVSLALLAVIVAVSYI